MTIISNRTSLLMGWLTFCLVLTFLALPKAALSAQVTLAWDPNQDEILEGYTIHYRSCDLSDACEALGPSDALSQHDVPLNNLDNPQEPRYTLTTLADNRKYIFVVSAYGQGQTSGFSNTAYFTASGSDDNNPPASYTIRSSAGPNGSISPAGDVSVQPGSNRIFTITPLDGYRIDDVLVDGLSMGASETYTFHDIAADHSIQAVFIADTFAIRSSAGPNGSISPQGDVVVQRGSNRIFTISPNAGFRISDLTVDGQSLGPKEIYTFHNVTTDHNIYASFTAANIAPQADAGQDQRVSPHVEVILDGSRSQDPDGGIQTWQWIQIGEPLVSLANADSVQPSFTAPDPGPQGATLVFQLTVTDAQGLTATDTISVIVDGSNQPPQIDPIQGASIALGSPYLLQAPFTDANPGDTHQVSISWGDGSPWESGDIEVGDETYTGTASGRHVYNSPGTYLVSVCITDSEGAMDCGDFELQVEGSGIPVDILQANFDAGVDSFEYLDSPFSQTAQPAYAQGSHVPSGGYTGGALKITLGGQDDEDILDMSGGWQTSFSLDRATEVALSFRYILTQWPNYERDEKSQVIVTLDGNRLTLGENDFVSQIEGDGEGGGPLTTGWQIFEANLGTLASGRHTLVIGGYNNKKTYHNEVTELLIDDTRIIGMFADGGRPVGGFESDHLIPASRIEQSTEGDGLVTIQFKIKDPARRSCSLYDFAYSIDAGENWLQSVGGDASPALADGWQDNRGSGYSTAATFQESGIHQFTFNTKHSSLAKLQSAELDDLLIRFRIRNAQVESALPVVSEPFAINNQGPIIEISFGGIDRHHVDAGTLFITANLSEPSTLSPTISIDAPGDMASIGPETMVAGGEPEQYRYSLSIAPHDGVKVIDGTYQVRIDNVVDANGNKTIGRASFRTDTLDSDGDGQRNYDDPDDDNDQLPDDWERRYGLDPLSSAGIHGGQGDFDGDGQSNLAEYLAQTDPAENIADDRPRVVATIPQDQAGIGLDQTPIPGNAAFCALVDAPMGVDITATTSLTLWVDDGENSYEPDCSDRSIVRIVSLIPSEDETRLTKFWLIYDRYNDIFGNFAFGSLITIDLEIMDSAGYIVPSREYSFQIETQDEHLRAEDSAPETAPLTEADPLLEPELGYDTGLVVMTGENQGVKVVFNSEDSVNPEIGPSDGIPMVSDPQFEALAPPLNIQPPTVSDKPVKILIPCPGETDLSDVSILFYNGSKWIQACNGDGKLLETGEGWMVPDSREIHIDTESDTVAVEIKTYQLSGVQVVREVETDGGSRASAINCFIGTIGFGD